MKRGKSRPMEQRRFKRKTGYTEGEFGLFGGEHSPRLSFLNALSTVPRGEELR